MLDVKSIMLLLRFSNYKKSDFVLEHSKIINSAGSVWMLKVGKKVPRKKMELMYGNGGTLLLRAPKAQGGGYYKVQVDSFYEGKPLKNMNFPDYYHLMLMDDGMWQMDSLDGSWFKISSITMIENQEVEKLVLASNGKKVEEVLNSTRSSMLYVNYEQ